MNQLSKCLSKNYGVSLRSHYGLLTRSEFVLRNSTSQIHNPLQWDLTLKLGSHHGKRCLHIAASAQLPGSRQGTTHKLPSLDQSLAIFKKLRLSKVHSCRQFSSSSFLFCERKDSEDKKSAKSSSSEGTESTGDVEVKLTQRQRLKRAVKEYGPVVIVFHICIALISLGFFYSLVSMGVDVIGILRKLGVSEKILESGLATGASTFVVAYAVHKLFAVPRIGITLTCAPMIVHKLRKLGVFKPPKP